PSLLLFGWQVAGLVVNIIMMLVLGHNHSHGHSHGHSHDDHSHAHGEDHTTEDPHSAVEEGAASAHHRRRRNLALDAAFIHVLGDLIQSVGVVIAAALIWWKPFDIGSTSDGVSHWNYFDPICTVIFSVLVLLTTTRTLRRSLRALMHKAPEHVDVHLLQTKLREIPYVDCVHDVHVWNVGSANAICTAHVGLKGCDNCSAVLAEAKAVASDMGISHSTFQLEACSEDIDEKERRMALEYNKELIKQARLGIMDGEKGVKFLASEVARIQGQDGLNYSEKPYFRSALWEATWKNNEPAVRYLIDKRANVNFKDRDGRTPLHEASRYGHAALVELLLDSEADIDATDSAGETPLSQAVSGCRHDVVTLLVSKGAKVHTTDSEGITVQHLAAFAGDPRMADWLFYKGAWKNRYAVEHVDYQEEDSTAGDDLEVAFAPEGTEQAVAQDEGEERDEEAEVTVDEQA
ncbi:hypothetical protein FOZ61_010239, partial [Perkinsus olseni]